MEMHVNIGLMCSVLVLAYGFDFINGFHDAANSIATIVTTGVLTPKQAVLWAAFFNFIAFLFFRLMVAQSIGSDLIVGNLVDTTLIFVALISAIAWGLLTWYLGIPSSSSHAIMGGLAGAAIVKGGFGVLILSGFNKVLLGIFVSPLLGLFTSYCFIKLTQRWSSKQAKASTTGWFAKWQLLSSACLSLAHGGNDAQKTMGIIAMLLFANGWLHGSFYVPWWVIISCNLMISLGTLAGGWRIVKTMGTQITTLNTYLGCAAELSAASVIALSTQYGIPISTTQTVTGAITGTGIASQNHAINWRLLLQIAMIWMITLPATALLSGCLLWLLQAAQAWR